MKGANRPLAQIITIASIVLTIACCVCGGLLAGLSLQPLPGDEVVLPNGQIADATYQGRVAIIVLCLTAVLAITILLLGLGVWYVYGRDNRQVNLMAQAIAVFLFIASIFFCLWTGLVIVTASLTDGLLATGQTLGTGPAMMVSLACLVPAILSALASLAIWFFFIRQQPARELKSELETDAQVMTVEAYLVFMKGLLQRGETNKIDASVDARTRLTLHQATVEDKVRIIRFLYDANLIKANPLISLKDVNLTALDLAEAQLAGIQLAGADLTSSNLRNANLEEANLQAAILRTADLRFANLTAVNLQNADLHEAKLHGSILHRANLRDASLIQANLWQADLTDAQIAPEQLALVKSLKEAILPDGSKG